MCMLELSASDVDTSPKLSITDSPNIVQIRFNHSTERKVGGGGKTAQKPTSSAAPPLCNICGGNHTMDACRRKGLPDTNTDVSVKWSDSAVGKAWKDRHDCNWRPGGPTVTLDNYVKQGEQAKKEARNSPISSGLRKRSDVHT
jgi:hypothetical protein